ncbi:unnamed protein product [Linum trigynum]|uniref:Uncharacterized protein n=1 Tax=Linum trigynum TaxID=586398 RepID=A0AAV2DYT8_9ROSI
MIEGHTKELIHGPLVVHVLDILFQFYTLNLGSHLNCQLSGGTPGMNVVLFCVRGSSELSGHIGGENGIGFGC